MVEGGKGSILPGSGLGGLQKGGFDEEWATGTTGGEAGQGGKGKGRGRGRGKAKGKGKGKGKERKGWVDHHGSMIRDQ